MPLQAGLQPTHIYEASHRAAASAASAATSGGAGGAGGTGGAVVSGVGSVSGLERPVLLHFRGTLDVCCSGFHARCALGKLVAEAWHRPELVLRPAVPTAGLNNSGWGGGQCTRKAVGALAARLNLSEADAFAAYAQRSQEMAAPPPALGAADEQSRSGSHGAVIDTGMLRVNEVEMLRSVRAAAAAAAAAAAPCRFLIARPPGRPTDPSAAVPVIPPSTHRTPLAASPLPCTSPPISFPSPPLQL